MAADWIIPRGTVGFAKKFIIKQGGSPKDLTGYTVTLVAWEMDTEETKFSGECTKTDEANGEVTYTTQEGDVDAEENYYFNTVLTKTGETLPTVAKTLQVTKAKTS